MIQILPQYLLILKARLQQPKYQRIPNEEPMEETTNHIHEQKRSYPSKEELDSLYKRIVTHKEKDKQQYESNSPPQKQVALKSLYERIKEQKQIEQAQKEELKLQAQRQERAEIFARNEIRKIEQMLTHIPQEPRMENIIDARTTTLKPQPLQLRLPSRKEMGYFTKKLLEPLVKNLSSEIITK